jgi:branched-chain amino acid transport system permease protein
MSIDLFIEQLFNGLGYGFMLFLLAAGLTLVFGVMDTFNLGHGTLFMLGAFIGATVHEHTGSFLLAVGAAVVGVALIALVLERLLMKRLYAASHLTQVIATLGIILIAEDLVKATWGSASLSAPTPEALRGPVYLLADWPYPSYRLLILAAGLATAGALYLLVNKTRLGMLVRAGASNRQMAELMGVRVQGVFALVFVISAALAGLAGVLMSPVTAVVNGMGESILVPALVVIVIGGIGSVRGAFIAALAVGLVETSGRAFLPPLLKHVLEPAVAADVGSAAAGILMYLLMAVVLSVRPTGLFAARG